LGGSYFNFSLWAIAVISFFGIASVFSGINSSWKLFLISTFLCVFMCIDVTYFVNTYPANDCLKETVVFDMKNGNKFSQSDVIVCRYKTTIEGEYGDWAIPQEK
jgi:hypothetical protein